MSDDDRDFEMTGILMNSGRIKNRGTFKKLVPGCTGRIISP